jgi:GNAT superfamily N-acetyltransferase
VEDSVIRFCDALRDEMVSRFDDHSQDVWPAIAHLEVYYPGFELWFYNKVASGIRESTRQIFVEMAGAEVAGIAIAKRGPIEKKLCTLYVVPKFRNRRVASRLAERAFDWMGTEKPLFTVPEEKTKEFGRLLGKWGFFHSQTLEHAYRAAKTEHIFNGFLHHFA